MALSSKLLDVLVCPQCKGNLAQVEGGQGLFCNRCQLKYPVREGIPVMLVEEALDMRTAQGGAQGPGKTASKSASLRPVSAKTSGQRVIFKVIAGPDAPLSFDLQPGFCRAIGRSVGDANKTTVLNVDWALSLDEETKGLVLQYISQQFRKPPPPPGAKEGRPDQLGTFRRGGDVVLKDHTLSRLHAMIFFDDLGIGVLDLVSKNGTFVNGEEIESRLLKKGDTIELGETKIVFEG